MESTALEHDAVIWKSIDNGRQLVLASTTLIIYEYLITLDQEVKFFWGGKWTPSRILYLSNRYLPPLIMACALSSLWHDDHADPSLNTQSGDGMLELAATYSLDLLLTVSPILSCDKAIRAIFGLSTVALFVIQGILVVRVFYLFSHSTVARFIIAGSYVVSITATIVLEYNALHGRPLLTPLAALAERVALVGCPVHQMKLMWHLFLPAFSLHTVLYIFTLIRVLSCEDSPQALLIRRLHRDGGFFYLVVIAAVGYTEIGAGLSNIPTITIPAVFANFILVATSISISRVMLSFHTLADHIRNDPSRRVVNGIPLSRVTHAKRGSNHEEHLVMLHRKKVTLIPPPPTHLDISDGSYRYDLHGVSVVQS
ncbi:hypothetical protein JB92DRAFT_3115082 [Gautieria morchelliformis]|nr:hypothetical protein JB92DRAFT_3115082 [Gautieria morchelliformis]